MVENNGESRGTAFTVSVDAATGVSTGISAADRAKTIRTLGAPGAEPGDLVRPGHIFPLRARAGGVLMRAGHTEAAVDLAHLAGGAPCGVLCEVVNEDRSEMARGDELARIASNYRLPMISIADLAGYRMASERLIEHTASARVPTAHGSFTCHAWRSLIDGTEHLAFVCGTVARGDPILVRVHSECLTGDVFGSARCDCGAQLRDALEAIASEGQGVVVYLRGHEGRGIGLSHKLMAYNLQDQGHDTVDANLELGLPVDTREYGVGAQILADLGVQRIRLMTNNPAKYHGLVGFGPEIVERVALPPRTTPDNIAYLATKRRRMGHLLDFHSVDLTEAAPRG
jgi:3,4-dihydroxy 2-butanone 4-phosphate synthase/GTP cyclohydrolase II